jgi:hypothetical protein
MGEGRDEGKPLPNPLLKGEGIILQADFELINVNLSASKTSGEVKSF